MLGLILLLLSLEPSELGNLSSSTPRGITVFVSVVGCLKFIKIHKCDNRRKQQRNYFVTQKIEIRRDKAKRNENRICYSELILFVFPAFEVYYKEIFSFRGFLHALLKRFRRTNVRPLFTVIVDIHAKQIRFFPKLFIYKQSISRDWLFSFLRYLISGSIFLDQTQEHAPPIGAMYPSALDIIF